MVNGADSVKEEYHNWARQFVRRGIAALTIDGPGQGAMVGILPMRPEAWERPMGATIDALAACGKVDARRIGIWGSSLGGFLVLRAAAYEPRLQAAISLGGFYDCRDYRHWPVSTQLNVMEDLMLESLSDARDYVEEKFTLDLPSRGSKRRIWSSMVAATISSPSRRASRWRRDRVESSSTLPTASIRAPTTTRRWYL